eukprot:4262394-Alexandrium_andersonii.AAC.1
MSLDLSEASVSKWVTKFTYSQTTKHKDKAKGYTWTQMKFQCGGEDANIHAGMRAGDIYEEDSR